MTDKALQLRWYVTLKVVDEDTVDVVKTLQWSTVEKIEFDTFTPPYFLETDWADIPIVHEGDDDDS